MMKTDYNWLVCQAHTKAECWATLALMIQLTPLVESIWRKGLVAFAVAGQVVELRELQVRCPMRVVDLDIGIPVTPEFELEVLGTIEDNTEWREITDAQAQELLKLGKELNLEFGSSYLMVRPPGGLFQVRAVTAAKHVDDDIWGMDDLQPELLKAFTRHPTLV